MTAASGMHDMAFVDLYLEISGVDQAGTYISPDCVNQLWLVCRCGKYQHQPFILLYRSVRPDLASQHSPDGRFSSNGWRQGNQRFFNR